MNIETRIRSGCLAVAFAVASCIASASEMPRVFMTSVKGNGDLSTWPDAKGQTGLQAADQICRTRAAAASLPDANNYIAFLSDSSTDAYCRIHGASGRVYVNQCGSSTLPSGAGPWFRLDDLPAIDISQNAFVAFPEVGYSQRHILYDEFGTAIPALPSSGAQAFTGTLINGVLDNPGSTCGDWTSASIDLYADTASAYWGFGWPSVSISRCDKEQRLTCMETGVNGSPLPRHRPSTARMAFVTSVSGTGKFSTWADSDGATSDAGADAICQNRARIGELPLPQSYKAWIATTSFDANDRLQHDGPVYRTDGVLIARSNSDFSSGVLRAPFQVDEYAEPSAFRTVWTGTLENGASIGLDCNNWTDDEQAVASFGLSDAADANWTRYPLNLAGCADSTLGLYCIGDNDSVFLDGFEDDASH